MLVKKCIGISLLFLSINLYSQGYTVYKVNDNFKINFIDEFNDKWYMNGEEIINYGELDLNERDYKQLIKDIKKTLKQTEKELDRPNYAIIKYSWVKDTVWVYWDKKAFSVTKSDIEYLNSKL